MKKIRKLFALLGLMTIALTGCGTNSEPSSTTSNKPVVTDKNIYFAGPMFSEGEKRI